MRRGAQECYPSRQPHLPRSPRDRHGGPDIDPWPPEGVDRTDREAVEDSEGHPRPTPAAAVGGGRPDGEGRAWPGPLRALPPASGSPAEQRRLRSTSGGRRHTCPRSRLLVADRAKALWICRFASTTSTRSGCCRYWLNKQPERRSPGGNVGRRVCARRHRSDRGSGLRAPTPAAIPIAPLHSSAAISAEIVSTTWP